MEDPHTPARMSPADESHASQAPLRILLVDDDAFDRLAVRRYLLQSSVSATVDEAASAAETLERIDSSAYDCLLLDYYLPGVEGLALLQTIRAAVPEIPVVIFTGRGDEEVAVELMKAGAVDYLPKASLTSERLASSLRHAMELARTVAAQRRAEQAMRASEERFRRAFEIETVGIIFFNTDGRIIGANDAFLRMGGYSREDIAVGRLRWDELTPPERRPHLLRAVEEFKATGRTAPYEEEYLRKDGSRWWALFAAMRLNEHEGVEFVIDISERKNAEAEGERLLALEREARTRAERAIHERDALMAIVAHDLHNPIQSIALSVEAMLEEPLPPEELVQELEMMGRSVEVMERLISDLLDSARLESGRFAVELASVDIVPLFDEMLEVIEPQAHARGITVTREVPADVPLMTADRARLVQVLSNLVTNALKFTSAGGSVSIRVHRLDGVIQISVEDSGTGIPAADLPHVFDRYWQADPTSQTGSGLGLSICKGIVEAHGGRIWVESIVGRGTTFHFTVPCAND